MADMRRIAAITRPVCKSFLDGAAPRVVVETAYSSTVCALVLAGNGCGIVDPLTAIGYVERGLILKPLDPEIRLATDRRMKFNARHAGTNARETAARRRDQEKLSPNGILSGALPVRCRSPFATAAPVIGTPISPAPLGAAPDSTTRTSISGMSAIRISS